MTTQSTAVSTSIKSFFDRPDVKAKLTELLNKNASSFTTSVLQIVSANSMLAQADPMSIFNAACMAATLNLPINNTLGFAYIVPYKNKKANKKEAQFQLGYKGFIQLAQRSGQFERLVSLPVYKQQLVKKDLINGFVFDWDNEPEENEQPVGYYAYFKLINGFSAEIYMSTGDILKHAKKYSQTYRNGYGNWNDNFEAMALKTVTKLLLSKQAPLSIEMQKAVMSDQAVIKDITNEQYEYIDNDESTQQQAISNDLIPVDDTLFANIKESVSTGDLELNDAINRYQLTEQQITELRG